MGKMGTDVARESADMVLADDNFATIVAAVEEGRTVFANVKKFVHYPFSCNLSEILTMFVAILVGLPAPLLPLQILWLNLITDVFPPWQANLPRQASCAARRQPRRAPNIRPSPSFVVWLFKAYCWRHPPSPLSSGLSILRAICATTGTFLTLGLAQLFHVFNSRFEIGSAFKQGFFSNRAIWAALGLTIALQVIAVTLSIPQMI